MASKVQYKSFSHWLSYHWGWLLGGAVLALLAAHACLTASREPKPDYTISWVGSSALSGEEEASLSSAVSRMGADQNGDGQVVVSVSQYLIDFSLSPDDPFYQDSYASHLKLLAQIQAGECYLFLLEDPEGFQSSTGALQYLDGTIPSEAGHYECANWEEMCVPWRGLGRQCWLGRRALFGSGGSQELYPGSDALFDAAAAG